METLVSGFPAGDGKTANLFLQCNPETGIIELRRRCAVYRRVQGLEEDLEKSEEKLIIANQKLDKVNTT
jgi:hypothetical protein